MADEEHLKLIQSGSIAWNGWRQGHPDIIPDLSGASLSGQRLTSLRLSFADLSLSTLKKANLRGSDCWQTNLNLADLSGSDMGRCSFGRAQLHTANLNTTKLYGTRFSQCDLSGADLSHARLFRTELTDSELRDTDFSYAWIKQSVFSNVDLRHARGLETVKFIGPSTLGIDSIYRSGGQIPISFLRGCGVPEDFVRMIPTLHFDTSLQQSCFICHNNMDRVFCEQLCGDLRANSVRCWYFRTEFSAGREVFGGSDAAYIYDRLLVVCSKNSLTDPLIVAEMERALAMQRNLERRVLFCLTRDSYLTESWEHPDKEAFVNTVAADFRHWERIESYERGLSKLVEALAKV